MRDLSKLRVLVADDLDAYRNSMIELLREMGVKFIYGAADGEEAWHKALLESKGTEPFDLIVSDINMPKMNGIELLIKVRALNKTAKTPFILVSTENEKKLIYTALEQGISDYIIKPWEKEPTKKKLTKVIEKILVGG